MIEKLSEAEKRFEEISAKLSDADIISDQEQYKKLMKEFKSLLPLVETFRRYKKADADARREALRAAQELRGQGRSVAVLPMRKNMKRQIATLEEEGFTDFEKVYGN